MLHAGRQVRGLAHGGVVHPEIATDGSHYDIPGVDPNADLYLHALRPAKLIRVAPHGILHAERGVARPDSVILMGDRCAKERHDTVAHHLVDRTLIVMDRLHHPLEHGVEQLAGLLGVTVGKQLHRTLQVGEEDCDLLALALEGTSGREDLLREVLGRIRFRGGVARWHDWLGERVGALRAELSGGGELRAAVRARTSQRPAALFAEFCLRPALVLAPGTQYTRSSLTRHG